MDECGKTVLIIPEQMKHLIKESKKINEKPQTSSNIKTIKSDSTLLDSATLNNKKKVLITSIVSLIVAGIIVLVGFNTNAPQAGSHDDAKVIGIRDYQILHDDNFQYQNKMYYYNLGNSFFMQQKWDQAIENYRHIINVDPGYLNVSSQLKKAEYEFQNNTHLQEGKALIEKQNIEAGISKLKEIKNDSYYYSMALLLIKSSQDKQKTAENSAKLIIEKAITAYIEGNHERSINQLQSLSHLAMSDQFQYDKKVVVLKQHIEKVYDLYNQGLNQYQANDIRNAFGTWAEIFDIDKNITKNKKSYYSIMIGKYLSNYYYQLASKAFNQFNYSEAHAKCKDALRAFPENKECIKLLTKINKRRYQ